MLTAVLWGLYETATESWKYACFTFIYITILQRINSDFYNNFASVILDVSPFVTCPIKHFFLFVQFYLPINPRLIKCGEFSVVMSLISSYLTMSFVGILNDFFSIMTEFCRMRMLGAVKDKSVYKFRLCCVSIMRRNDTGSFSLATLFMADF